MLILNFLLLSMLIIAIAIIAIPFIRSKIFISKRFFSIAALISSVSLVLYYSLSDQSALTQWLTQGKQHYQLLMKVDELGGIDAIINRIQQRLATNPNDARGWFILGKLYLHQKDLKHAQDAFTKAHKLAPNDEEITRYYKLDYH